MKEYALFGIFAVLVGTVGFQSLPEQDFPYEHMREVSFQIKDVGGGDRGSGVLVAPDLILTNAHVVGTSKEMKVADKDGIIVFANLVWRSEENDVALLRTDISYDFAPATFDCDGVSVGEEVAAVGNPMLLNGVFTFGRIASLEAVPTEWIQNASQRALFEKEADNVRVDIRIGPGSSGSPLFNKNGEVVGLMNIAWLAPLGWGAVSMTGISDMVPATQFCDYLPH